MTKVDSLFTGLGTFDSSSGVMFTTEDDTGKKEHWVNAALSTEQGIRRCNEAVTRDFTMVPC